MYELPRCLLTFGESSGFGMLRLSFDSGASSSIGTLRTGDGVGGMMIAGRPLSAGYRAEENVASSRAASATSAHRVRAQKPSRRLECATGHFSRSSRKAPAGSAANSRPKWSKSASTSGVMRTSALKIRSGFAGVARVDGEGHTGDVPRFV
jgi:hypothetical protein